MTEKRWVGIVSDDPLIDRPIGSDLKFAPVAFGNSNATGRADIVTNWEFFNGAILGLSLKSEEGTDLIGTAVLIAPGLAITATHNLTNVMGKIERGEVVPYCYGIRPSGIDIWQVLNVSFSDDDDISYISLKAASAFPLDGTYYQLPVTTRAPKNGEVLHIVGFRRELPVVDSTNVTITSNLYTASGTVTAVYPNGRDTTLIPYPVIELNCGSLGGMSGGAAIDQSGHLVGVISRGLETNDGFGPTYVSWIVTSLGRSLDIPWPPAVYKGTVSPLSMNNTTMLIERPEAVKVIDTKQIAYQIWFE